MLEEYLGDGVYAVYDGYSITLDLRCQGNEKICLDPEVLNNLDRFRQAIAESHKDRE